MTNFTAEIAKKDKQREINKQLMSEFISKGGEVTICPITQRSDTPPSREFKINRAFE